MADDLQSILLESNLLPRAEEMCKQRLKNDPKNRVLLRWLAEVCRKRGNLAEAATIYEQLYRLDPQDQEAGYMQALLGGREWPAAPWGMRAAPFVVLRDFLPREIHDAFVPFLVSARAGLDSSEEWDGKQRFMDHFEEALPGAISRLHVASFSIDHVEVDCRAKQDAPSYNGHIDAAQTNPGAADRAISFVYFFHTLPRPYSGGDLLLFDSDPALRKKVRTRFTRVVPEHNALVVFPGNVYHRLVPVRCPGKESDESRCALKGFVRKCPANGAPAATDKFAPFRQRLFDSPELYPLVMHDVLNRFGFVPMTRERYRDVSFHDPRYLDDSDQIEVKFDELAALYGQQRNGGRSAHFIFHTGLCGSTLLSRYLDGTRHFFAYREPSALTQLAQRKYESFRRCERSQWARALEITVAMLARTEKPEEVSVIKLPEVCNNLFDELLNLRPDSRGLVLYSDAETFLLATLKTPERRRWIRNWIERRYGNLPDEVRNVDTASLSDAEACAFVWLTLILFCRRGLERHPTRLRSLNCQSLFKRPVETLEAVAHLFGKTLRRELVDGIVAAERTTHAKDGGHFDANVQARQRAHTEKCYAEEMKNGVAWVNERLGKGGAALLPLPLPLL